jgi:hypothetical protein
VLGRYLLPYLGGTTVLTGGDEAEDALAVEWASPVA